MADNIDDEHLDNPTNTHSDNSSDEVPTKYIHDPEPSRPNQETENMEVHKHSHHVMHSKKWHEYLLEFFMLFLAVFLGFVAENIRENIHNREVEKTNIKSLLENLHEDSLNLVRTTEVNEKRFMFLDSLIDLKNSSVSDKVFQQHFIYYDLKLGYNDYFQSNQSAFEQMQSSGTLRLINEGGVLDSILKYEALYKQTRRQEDVCSMWWNKAIEQVSLIFDWTSVSHLPADSLWQFTLDDLANIPLSKIDRHSPGLQLYFNWQVNERISLGYYVTDLHYLLSYNRILISYLEKEYELE